MCAACVYCQAVVLEGKYWKRRMQSVTSEYQKWRLFFKDRFSKTPEDQRLMQEVSALLCLVCATCSTMGILGIYKVLQVNSVNAFLS